MDIKPIKIMYLIDVYRDPYAGTEKQLYNLVKGLDRNEFLPAMTLFRSSEYINKYGFACDVSTLGIRKLVSPVTLHKLIKYALKLRSENYKIVHIYFNDASIIAPILFKLAGLKVLISRRDMGYWYTASNLCILKVNRFFIDAVIVNSHAIKRLTHEKEKIPPEKIRVIYNGYESTKATNSFPEKSPLGDIDKDVKIVGIVANIRPIKRIDILISAFSHANKSYPKSVLVIVGDGDAAELKILAKELRIENVIYFLGKQDDVANIIKVFDIGVICSESEGFSNAIIEYMQARVPVIATDTGGNPELIKDGVSGYLVPVNNIKALADKIEMILSEKIDTEKITANAYNHVTNLCKLDSMISRHTELYKTL